jgi:hypothetical protein
VTRALRVVLLAAPSAVVVAVGWLLIAAAGRLTDATPCAAVDNRAVDLLMVVVCVGAFVLGRWLVDKRDQSADELVDSRHDRATGAQALLRAAPGAARRGALIAHVSLALFFAAGVAVLTYETVSLWSDNPWGLQPITHYVRCAKGVNWPLTLLVAATVSFFAGHWLWFPMRRRDG